MTKDKAQMIMGNENSSNLTMMDKIQIKNPNNNKNKSKFNKVNAKQNKVAVIKSSYKNPCKQNSMVAAI